MNLSKKKLAFLSKLHLNRHRDITVREVGREIYTTDMSVYSVLKKLEAEEFVVVEKGKKHLKAELTPKGIKAIK